ncbi:MAG: D-alanyl-D-alanine carboxypeptidase, partial [Gemmatimonadales bacterium]
MAGLRGSGPFALTLVMAGLVGWAKALPAQTDSRWLGLRMNDWYAEASRSAPGDWGIAVADQAGQMLWSFNADASLMPASTVKLFTTGYARSVLGGNARRATRLIGTGVVDPKTGE